MLQKRYRHSNVSTTIGYQSNFIHEETDDALDAVIGKNTKMINWTILDTNCLAFGSNKSDFDFMLDLYNFYNDDFQ